VNASEALQVVDRLASTIQRMLLDIVHVGNDLRWLPGGGAGMTLLIGDMSIAGS